MQQLSFWKRSLLVATLASGLLATPGCSRKAAPGSAPETEPPSAPADSSTPATPSASSASSSPTEPGPGATAAEYVKSGMDKGEAGDLDAAISAFNEAIKLDPKYAPAYYARGFACSLQNKTDDAIANYTLAIQMDPTFKAAYYERGSLRGQQGDFAGASNDFNEVIKLDPKYAPAHYNRGHVQYFNGDLDGATREINEALNLQPNFPFSYFIRGLIWHAQGKKTEAASDFQKSAGLGFPYAALYLWITEMESGQHGLAQTDLEGALSKANLFKPDDWPTQIADYLLGQLPQEQLLAKAREGAANGAKGDRLCKAWFFIGTSQRLSGDTAAAKTSYTNAVATGAKSSEEYVESKRALTTLKKS